MGWHRPPGGGHRKGYRHPCPSRTLQGTNTSGLSFHSATLSRPGCPDPSGKTPHVPRNSRGESPIPAAKHLSVSLGQPVPPRGRHRGAPPGCPLPVRWAPGGGRDDSPRLLPAAAPGLGRAPAGTARAIKLSLFALGRVYLPIRPGAEGWG